MSYAFLPALNKSLHATFLEVWLCRTWLVFHVSVTTAETLHTTSLCCHSLFGLHKCSASIDECQWAQCFLHEGNQSPPFAPYTLPCQMPLRQSVPLLPSVAQQQNVMEYGWEGSTSTAISPPSASDVVSQHNKIGGVTFGAALLYVGCNIDSAPYSVLPAAVFLLVLARAEVPICRNPSLELTCSAWARLASLRAGCSFVFLQLRLKNCSVRI